MSDPSMEGDFVQWINGRQWGSRTNWGRSYWTGSSAYSNLGEVGGEWGSCAEEMVEAVRTDFLWATARSPRKDEV